MSCKKIITERKFLLSLEKEATYILQMEKYLDFCAGIAVLSLGHAHPN